MVILSERLWAWLVMSEFAALPLQSQMICLFIGLFLLKPAVKSLVDLWDYISIGRERRLELKAKQTHFFSIGGRNGSKD